MGKIKYIKTKDNNIVVFNEYFSHDDFKHYEPISAGFVSFSTDKDGCVVGRCYGESISLGLKADETKDTMLLNLRFFDNI